METASVTTRAARAAVGVIRFTADVNAFEVDLLALYVDAVDADLIATRRGLTLGARPPSMSSSRTWGVQQ